MSIFKISQIFELLPSFFANKWGSNGDGETVSLFIIKEDKDFSDKISQEEIEYYQTILKNNGLWSKFFHGHIIKDLQKNSWYALKGIPNGYGEDKYIPFTCFPAPDSSTLFESCMSRPNKDLSKKLHHRGYIIQISLKEPSMNQ